VASQKSRRGLNGLPWYRKDRDVWVVPGDPRKLAVRDRDGNAIRGEHNREAAMAAWHETQSLANAGRRGEDSELRAVLQLYLHDLKPRVEEDTYANYGKYYTDFLGLFPGLAVRELKPLHVRQWFDARPGWGQSTRAMAGSTLKAALNWASKPGKGDLIPRNPLDGMSLPAYRKRSAEVVLTDEEFEYALSFVKAPAVWDVLVVLRLTGTRPVNLARATAAHLSADGTALVLNEHKTAKKTGLALVIPLPDAARDICLRLKAKYPEGPLFRTTTGLPWDKHRLSNLVKHYAKRAGLKGRLVAYSGRHSKATHLLEAGVSDVDVAAILGNTPAVIHRNYSHVAARVARLRELANRHAPITGLRTPGTAPPADVPSCDALPQEEPPAGAA
jgi:integrase